MDVCVSGAAARAQAPHHGLIVEATHRFALLMQQVAILLGFLVDFHTSPIGRFQRDPCLEAFDRFATAAVTLAQRFGGGLRGAGAPVLSAVSGSRACVSWRCVSWQGAVEALRGSAARGLGASR